MTMLIPDYLKKGDTIGVAATARKVSFQELQPAINLFEKWGLKVKLGKNLFNIHNQFSGTDNERASDLQQLLDDNEVKAIIGARGGYGTMRIIDKIDFTAFKKNPKWITGYSDVTALHSHVIQNYKAAVIHGPMAFNVTHNETASESLRKALFGELFDHSFPSHPLNKIGSSEGVLVGGNLSIIYAIVGSKSDINTDGKILFIEDLDEYLYHIDRMMISLKRAGKLDKLKGLVVGGMSDMKDNAIGFGKSVEEIILDAVKEYDYPVCFNFNAGHIEGNNALYLGRKIKLEVAERSRIKYL